ncbi:hypothetical protein BH20CHL7_BH20CHL7_07180 [soil metagenome]
MTYQRLALTAWVANAVTMSLLLAWAVPTLLTGGAIASVAVIVLLVVAPRSSKVLWISVVGAAVVVIIGLVFRAGPTSGIQLPNVVIIVLAGVALVTSVMALRSLAVPADSR